MLLLTVGLNTTIFWKGGEWGWGGGHSRSKVILRSNLEIGRGVDLRSFEVISRSRLYLGYP